MELRRYFVGQDFLSDLKISFHFFLFLFLLLGMFLVPKVSQTHPTDDNSLMKYFDQNIFHCSRISLLLWLTRSTVPKLEAETIKFFAIFFFLAVFVEGIPKSLKSSQNSNFALDGDPLLNKKRPSAFSKTNIPSSINYFEPKIESQKLIPTKEELSTDQFPIYLDGDGKFYDQNYLHFDGTRSQKLNLKHIKKYSKKGQQAKCRNFNPENINHIPHFPDPDSYKLSNKLKLKNSPSFFEFLFYLLQKIIAIINSGSRCQDGLRTLESTWDISESQRLNFLQSRFMFFGWIFQIFSIG